MATAWIGLGAMGWPMAKNLAEAGAGDGKPLVLHNRTFAKAASLAAAAPPGLTSVAATVADAVAGAAVVHVMLADDGACDEVIAQILAAGDPSGRIIVNHSTVHPDCSKRAAAAAHEAGVVYVACPVFGRPDAAAARKLLVVQAGPPEALARVAKHLEALGRPLPPIGEDAHKANVLKLTGNFMIASVIEMESEALALAEKHGVGRESVLNFIEAFFPAPPIVGYARRIATGDLDAGTGFTVDLALKDVRYMRQLAESGRTPLPLADLVFNHLLAASAAGHGRLDWGAVSVPVRQAAGLPPVIAGAAAGAGAGDGAPAAAAEEGGVGGGGVKP